MLKSNRMHFIPAADAQSQLMRRQLAHISLFVIPVDMKRMADGAYQEAWLPIMVSLGDHDDMHEATSRRFRLITC